MFIVKEVNKEVQIILSYREAKDLYEDLEEKRILNTSSDDLMEELEIFK